MNKRIYGYRQKKRRLQIYELLINFIVTCRQRHACIGYAYPTFRQNKGRGMYQAKLEKDIRCPLEYGLDVFGGRWKSRIICVLAHQGTLRYGILKGEHHRCCACAKSKGIDSRRNSKAYIIRRNSASRRVQSHGKGGIRRTYTPDYLSLVRSLS